jgi:hypothetical protein
MPTLLDLVRVALQIFQNLKQYDSAVKLFFSCSFPLIGIFISNNFMVFFYFQPFLKGRIIIKKCTYYKKKLSNVSLLPR